VDVNEGGKSRPVGSGSLQDYAAAEIKLKGYAFFYFLVASAIANPIYRAGGYGSSSTSQRQVFTQ
jgi:hypothetical protein